MSPDSRAEASQQSRTRALPSGAVTFLFTDVEGSTRLLHELGEERYATALAEHRRVVRQTCAVEGGMEVDTQGDAFFMAFADAEPAARAAAAIGRELGDGPIRVRIGLHTGRPLLTDEGYIGEDVHLGARIAASGHGGQVLLSRETRDALAQTTAVVDLGEHRLKDIAGPIGIFQLGTDAFPPLKTISNTNLPRPADSFLGRDDELHEVTARIRAGRRLLTLLGPGGTGKTRLAVEAATSLLTDFKAGVFWIDLAPVRDPDAVATAIAATLGTEQELEQHIGEREMLLVLDNFEQVVAAAPRVGSLATACANLSVMVTSRERLRVRGESSFDVPALDQTDASRLFADRSGLPPSAEIDELCARLGNLPLAVELAAARVPALTPRQILDRLGDRLDMLKGGRDAEPRQRTLRATIEWSHELLNSEEQRVFRRLSVFAGGATLEAVEAVCESNIDTVELLIDKSLVRAADGRYTMLETVRQYAADRLEASGEAPEIHRRHGVWIRTLMAAQIPRLMAGGSDELRTALTAELGNINAAFEWHLKSANAAEASALLDTVWSFLGLFLWQSRAGLAMCEALLRHPGLSVAERALVRHREGVFAVNLDDAGRAREAWTEAAALARRVGDAKREGRVLSNLALMEPDPANALRLFERAMALQRPMEERELYRSKLVLADLKLRAGDAAAAEALDAEIYTWAVRVGDHEFMIEGDRALGAAALHRGDAVEAFERATRSRDLAVRSGPTSAVLVAELLRCRAAARLANDDIAADALGTAMDLVREGDLENDAENAADLLQAASELMAAVGDTDLASRLDAVRSRTVAGRPWFPPHLERLDRDWLEAHGVVPTIDTQGLDLPSALAAVRTWLQDRRTKDGPSHHPRSG